MPNGALRYKPDMSPADLHALLQKYGMDNAGGQGGGRGSRTGSSPTARGQVGGAAGGAARKSRGG